MAVTAHQLAVLASFGRTGSYKLSADELRLRKNTVRSTLVRVRCHYGTATTVQALMAAIVAGDLDPRTVVPVDRPA